MPVTISANPAPRLRTLGVLGGMGPMATIDFLRKLTQATPAQCDQDHVPQVVHFCSQVPDRSSALSGRGPSPLPSLLQAARLIEQSGAEALVIPCNTAHAWYDDIRAALKIPVLHIVDAVATQLQGRLHGEPIGLLATEGTLASGVYERRRPELRWLRPSDAVMADCVMPAIRAVKRNDIETATRLLDRAIEALKHGGASAVVLACTELPLAVAANDARLQIIDATDALARAALAWASADLSGPRQQHSPCEVF